MRRRKWETYSGNLQLLEVEVRHGGRRYVEDDEEEEEEGE